MIKILIYLILSYLIGAIPNGVIIAKIFFRVDPTKYGSGNIGATNVYRVAGKIPGIITLILDVLKGYLPVYAGMHLNFNFQIVLISGFLAFLGHLFPVYLKFKGGKGVATALGIFLCLTPFALLLDGVIFILIAAIWRYISLSSIISAFLLPGIINILLKLHYYHYPFSIVYFAGCISLLIIYKHKENIKRLIKGKEYKFGQKIEVKDE